MSRARWLEIAREYHAEGLSWNDAQRVASRAVEADLTPADVRGLDFYAAARALRDAGIPWNEAQKTVGVISRNAPHLGVEHPGKAYIRAAADYYRANRAR